MKIGIIVFSHTGNTHSVAQKLKDKFFKLGHSVTMEKIEISGNYQSGEFRIVTAPHPEKYEVLVFAAPVMAFSLSPVMKRYLPQIASLQNKKVAFLVTEYFPYKWMGGNRAIKKMKKICQAKGAEICGAGVVNWSRADRQVRIEQVVNEISGVF